MLPKTPSKHALQTIYHRLLNQHGTQKWWPLLYDNQPFEIICGSLLTQNTTWKNAVKSLVNMRAAGIWGWSVLATTNHADLVHAINPAGFQDAKARKLHSFAKLVKNEYDGDIQSLFSQPELRAILLNIWGVGPETADAIMLYAANRPTFVCDKYTMRIMGRLGWTQASRDYSSCRSVFMRLLPLDTQLFGEYHALIVRHGACVCTKTNPRCDACGLANMCAYRKANLNT